MLQKKILANSGRLLCGLFAALMLGQVASAATVAVTTTVDEDDGNLAGAVSMREAIRYSASGDTITVPAGTFTLTRAGANEDVGSTGDLDITKAAGTTLTINGAGAGATFIDANNIDRVFQLLGGNLTITDLTIRNGNTTNSALKDGGGIRCNIITTPPPIVTLTNVNFTTCNATTGFGGAVLMQQTALLNATGCTFTSCNGTRGGALFSFSIGNTFNISGCTFTTCTAPTVGGGAINMNSGTATITACNFNSCSTPGTGGGGAIMSFSTFPINVTGCNFTSNTGVNFGGGAIYNGGLTFNLNYCNFNTNSASAGGALINNNAGSIFNLVGCVLNGNSATTATGGGAIFANPVTSTNLTRCTVSNNTALVGAFGGGMSINGPSTFVDTAITGNQCSGGGGGGQFSFAPTMTNCTLSGNIAGAQGGGMNLQSCGGNFTQCTISGNTTNGAGFGGGFVHNIFTTVNSTVTLTNCTVTGNIGNLGGAIYLQGLNATQGTATTSWKSTIIAGNTGTQGQFFGQNSRLLNSQGFCMVENTTNLTPFTQNLPATDQLGASPLLNALGDNGGATRTHSLQPGSPAIDTGNASTAGLFDQRGAGFPRVLGSALVAGGDGSDIGSFEKGSNGFFVTNAADSGAGSLRQAIINANAAANASGNPDVIQFRIPASGVQNINLSSPLPNITDAVTIDGYTQQNFFVSGNGAVGTGSTPNTLATSENAVLLIAIDGAAAGAGADGFTLSAGNSTIRGMAIGNFGGTAVNAPSAANRIVGNFIGTDATGTINRPNGAGVRLAGSNNVIGGTLSGDRNLILGSAGLGVNVASGTGNTISNNFVNNNGGLGIDLGNNGVTPNDAGDADSGANNLQNSPYLTSVANMGTNSPFATGVSPSAVAVADFNNDGKPDLAISNFNSNTISVLLNTNPNGTLNVDFAAAVNYPTGTSPRGIVAADLNGDTLPDLAVVNQGSANVSVLLNSGTGTFGAATNYPVATTPCAIAAADFNLDGRLDLVVANSGSGVVSRLLAAGAPGTFGVATNFAVGVGPIGIAVGDFNGDTRPDIATANFGANSVSVLLWTSTTTFGAALTFFVGTSPNMIALGDYDGDSRLDLFTTNQNSSNVSVLQGLGTGSFVPAGSPIPVGGSPHSVATGDFNGDGKLDMVVANSTSNNCSVFTGTGTGAFVGRTDVAVGLSPRAIGVGQLNGGGGTDLVVTNAGGANVTVLVGSGLGTFTATTKAISGYVDGISGRNYRIDVYANTAFDVSGSGEGEVLIATVASAANGAPFTVTYAPVAGKTFLTATATDLTTGDTSEFSRINQAPVNNVPPLTANEDVSSPLTGISISDPDSGSNIIQVALTVTTGVLTVNTGVPGGVTAGEVAGNSTNAVTLNSTTGKINTTLSNGGLGYLSPGNFNGSVTFTMTTNDQSFAELGGPLTTGPTNATITVIAVPDAPNLTSPASAALNEGASVGVVIGGTLNDTDGSELLSFSISNVPSALTFSNGSNIGGGVWNFTPAQTTGLVMSANDNGVFTLTISAIATEISNNTTATTSAPFQVNASNIVPVLNGVTLTPSVTENGSVTLAGSFSDPSTSDTYTLVIDWGDPSNPPGNIETVPYSTLAGPQPFTFNHTYLDDNPSGSTLDNYTVTISVTDDDSGAATQNFNLPVANSDPALTGLAVIDVNENGTTTLSGNIDDIGTLDTFTLTIDWGDGSPQDILVYGPSATGTQPFSVDHQYLDNNGASPTFTINLNIADDDGGNTDSSIDIAVTNVNPVITAANDPPVILEGSTLNITVANFTEVGTLDFHNAEIDWGDGTPLDTAGIITEPNAGNGFIGSIGGSHLFDDGPATYMVTVTVYDNDLGSDSGTFLVAVDNVSPTALFRKGDPENINYLGAVEFVNQFDPSVLDTTIPPFGLRYSYDFAYNGATPNFTYGAGDGSYAGSLITASISIPTQFLTNSPNHTILGRIIDKDGGSTDYFLRQPDFMSDENDTLLAEGDLGAAFSYTMNADGIPNTIDQPILYSYEIVDLPEGVTSLADVGLTFDGIKTFSGTFIRQGQITLLLHAVNLAGSDSAYLVITISGRGSETPQVISKAVAFPNPSLVGAEVEFSVVATDKDGDILSYFWTFGDGTSSRSRVSKHIYATPGNYVATVSISDGKHDGVFQHVNVVVLPADSNTFEITSAKITFDFKTATRSSLILQGKIPVPADIVVDGLDIDVSVTDSTYTQTFHMNSKGIGGDTLSQFTLKVAAPGKTQSSSKFTMHLKSTDGSNPLQPSLFQMLTPLGYKNKRSVKEEYPLQLVVTMHTPTVVTNFCTITTVYTCVPNKKGSAVKKK